MLNIQTHKQKKIPEHLTIHPSILYAGNPVALISSLNEDGSTNLSPMSSTWALMDRVVLGITSGSQAYENLRRHRECVINFPNSEIWRQIEEIARATGRREVPEYKREIGYEYVPDKFVKAGLTPLPSELVRPLRVAECPLQFEAQVLACHEPATWPQDRPSSFGIFETQVLRVHAHADIVIEGTNHIDTKRWHPLLYVFRHYFGTGPDLGRTFKAED